MAMLYKGRLWRQRLAGTALVLPLRRHLDFKLFLDHGQVSINRFVEQHMLLSVERCTGIAEAVPPI